MLPENDPPEYESPADKNGVNQQIKRMEHERREANSNSNL